MREPGALIEPLGLLDGQGAIDALRAGLALPLGDGRAYTLARLIHPAAATRIVAAAALPEPWRPLAARLAAPPPPWLDRVGPPAVMGILNVTPDSFSDGGRHLTAAAAIDAGLAMLDAGAAILDVGGESTRPGAAIVSVGEEQARIVPVVTALARAGATVSVDTRNAATMRAALDAGAAIINDVTALRHDPDAAGVVASAGCRVILMHMRGTPATMDREAVYGDIAVEVVDELAVAIAAAQAAGIARARIAVDPGFGFAKVGAQNQALLRRLDLFANLGCPLVIGLSRKRFIGAAGGASDPTRRLPGSLAAGLATILRGASVLRVHDVAETVQALRVWRSIDPGPGADHGARHE